MYHSGTHTIVYDPSGMYLVGGRISAIPESIAVRAFPIGMIMKCNRGNGSGKYYKVCKLGRTRQRLSEMDFILLDQDGLYVPQDKLVLLQTRRNLHPTDVVRILDCTWYQIEDGIAVLEDEVGDLVSPTCHVKPNSVYKVSISNKRYNADVGFHTGVTPA